MSFVKISKRAAKLLFLFVAISVLSSCGEQLQSHFKLSGSTMGTTYHVTILSEDTSSEGQQQLQKVIDQQLQLINQQMSTYISDSELSRLNGAIVGEAMPVSVNLFDVLILSLELGWLSNGAFDITVGPLVNLWGFGPSSLEQPNKIPTASNIERELAAVDFQAIVFDLEGRTVTKRKSVKIDLSAIAKGYAVDKIAELLKYAGYQDFMVEVGGELSLQGNSPRARPWLIAIEVPEAASIGQVQQALSLSNVSLATSGNYRNYFEHDGKRYSHTIDPRSGYPISHNLASVTVVAENAAYADGLATAITVMGPEQGLQLAQQQGLAVYLLVKTEQGFDAIYSDAFKVYLQ
ncbi:MAG: thiamine biosynthesis lipoprotein [Oceanicoccus sp.]|jgi:thiamine biosynthesis lipoprotein